MCPEVSCSTVAYAVLTWHRQKNMLRRTIVSDPINQLEASANELSDTMDSHPVAVSASVQVILFAGFPPLQTCARRPSVCCHINHLEAEDNSPSGILVCALQKCKPAKVFACNCELPSACAVWTFDSELSGWQKKACIGYLVSLAPRDVGGIARMMWLQYPNVCTRQTEFTGSDECHRLSEEH